MNHNPVGELLAVRLTIAQPGIESNVLREALVRIKASIAIALTFRFAFGEQYELTP